MELRKKKGISKKHTSQENLHKVIESKIVFALERFQLLMRTLILVILLLIQELSSYLLSCVVGFYLVNFHFMFNSSFQPEFISISYISYSSCKPRQQLL